MPEKSEYNILEITDRYSSKDNPSSSIWVYDQVFNLTKMGYRPIVISPSVIVPFNKFFGFTLNNLSKCLSRYGYHEGIKIIHAHYGQNGVAALALKNKLNVPLITSFYGFDLGSSSKVYKPYYKDLINSGNLFLALSQDMKKDLIRFGFPEKMILIHHLRSE